MHRYFQKELNKSLCFTKNSKQMCLKKNVIGSSGRLVEKLRRKSESIASLENLAGCTSAQSCQVSALGFTAVISENGLISRLFGLSSICIFSQENNAPRYSWGFSYCSEWDPGGAAFATLGKWAGVPAGKPELRDHRCFSALFFLLNQEFFLSITSKTATHLLLFWHRWLKAPQIHRYDFGKKG